MAAKKTATKKATGAKANKIAKAAPAEMSKAQKAKSSAGSRPQKLSAIDAAAKLLADAKEPMNTKALVEAMSAKGLWTGPGGKTLHAKLYSAVQYGHAYLSSNPAGAILFMRHVPKFNNRDLLWLSLVLVLGIMWWQERSDGKMWRSRAASVKGQIDGQWIYIEWKGNVAIMHHPVG